MVEVVGKCFETKVKFFEYKIGHMSSQMKIFRYVVIVKG